MFIKLFLLFVTIASYQTTLSLKSHLFYTSDGEIGAENYSYYYLEDSGNYKIQLITHDGDADLYISDANTKATYKDYKWQSLTYGIDEIVLRNTVERPLTIAVYGHPYYPSSRYTLNVYVIENDPENFEEFTYDDFIRLNSNYDDLVRQYSNYNDFIVNEEKQKKADDRDAKAKRDNDARNKKNSKNNQNQGRNSNSKKNNNNNSGDEEESLLTKIIVGILKLLAEIILN